jgi:hypothetical protein
MKVAVGVGVKVGVREAVGVAVRVGVKVGVEVFVGVGCLLMWALPCERFHPGYFGQRSSRMRRG